MSCHHPHCCCEHCCSRVHRDRDCHEHRGEKAQPQPPKPVIYCVCGEPVSAPPKGPAGRCDACGQWRCEHHHHHCPGKPQCPPTGPGPGNPNRPTRTPGTIRGGLDGHPLTPGDINGKNPPTSWPGPRKDLWLPYIFMRAFPGDTGTRPVPGVFWESPDVYLLAGVAPNAAPATPPQLGQTALAGKDNTIYAHVWNLGRAPAREVVVQFYICDPSLGFNYVGAKLKGTAFTNLGARGSGNCHKVVKCPESWVADYVNGGHECLLVRAWDVAADPMTVPEWDASVNRHLGQRNIHVVPAGQQMDQPLRLNLGPLFGMPAQVAVARTAPTNMPWLQLHTGVRGRFPAPAAPTGTVGLGTPGHALDQTTMDVGNEGAQVAFGADDAPPPAGSAHVYRVTASQGGQVFGGYTVVVLGG